MRGGLFLDALVGLLVVSIAFLLLLGEIALVTRSAGQLRQKTLVLLEETDGYTLDRALELRPAAPAP